jgi:hypothetical protein
MDPKASLAVAVSWAVVAQAGYFVAHIDFAPDGDAVQSVEVAGIAVADRVVVGAELVLVDGRCVRMIVVATGKMEEASVVVYSAVRMCERERARLARRDSCRCYIVAARTVHAAAELAEEAVRGSARSGIC